MSAPYIIPFNNQPVATGASSSTYTVPANKYARVTITLSVTAYASGTNDSAFGNTPAEGPSLADSKTIVIWAKAADAISFSTSAASASATAVTAQNRYATGTSSSSVRLNGATFSTIQVTAVGHTSNVNLSPVSVSGSAIGYLYYEEYNVIS